MSSLINELLLSQSGSHAEKETKYCSNCGEELDAEAEICPECGVRAGSRSSLSEHIEMERPASTVGAAALVGGIISVIGVFLPWLSFLGTTVTGLDFSGGVLVLVLSLLVMGLVYFTRWSKGIGGLTLFLGVLMFLSFRSVDIPGPVGAGDLGYGAGFTAMGIIIVALSGIARLIRGS